MRRGFLGALVVAACAPFAVADGRADGAPEAVTAADVLRWQEAGATADQLLTRVRVAPRVGRSSVADLEALTRAGVSPELIVLLLRRGADASPPPTVEPTTARGTLRLRARGAYDLHVQVQPGAIRVLTAQPGVEPAAGWFVVAAGQAERVGVVPGPFQLVVDDVLGPRLRVPVAGVSAVVVDGPGYYGFAEAIAAGRTDEDPPGRAPRDRVERDQQETYAARWARVTPELVEGYQGGTAMVHAGWRSRVPAVPRWYGHLTRHPHEHVASTTVVVTDQCDRRTVRVEDDTRRDCATSGRTLVLTGPYDPRTEPWRAARARSVHYGWRARLVIGEGAHERPWIYRNHR